jgi:hypothetical protein
MVTKKTRKEKTKKVVKAQVPTKKATKTMKVKKPVKKPVKKVVKSKMAKKPVKASKKPVKVSASKLLVKPGIASKAKKTVKRNSDVILDLRDELRIISMEYADIRARLNATDHYITHLLDKVDEEATFRKLNFLMSLALLVCLIIVLVLMNVKL